MDQRGQISIFFSASLIVLISIIAFVINIGLFVKAKINLQNATDAAAFSGAAVQARQLTKIAYLNWEMRNIYKEWMYKYYVVGNLNLKDVRDTPSDGPMSFRLEEDVDAVAETRAKDPYNFPAVCIHLANSKTNICRKYAIPGLPEFGGYELPGASEASRAFVDALVNTKILDCANRTRLNMLVTNTWAYNVLSSDLDNSLTSQGPAILADRQGAWPRAVELAMRIRNLEYVMNRPALSGGVCSQIDSQGGVKCAQTINEVISESKLGNERVIKAFYSGYRNLGNSVDNEMKETFSLREISPKLPPNTGSNYSASNLLIPEKYQKPFVDLKLMTTNLATFYAAMIPRAGAAVSAACDVSKTAIPVPGYPMGFYKNPDVLTYYAVKGEASFFGMFNPFNSEPIKLTAYSAAKPFGGRIGPMLFHQPQGADYFMGRTDELRKRSVPYFATIKVEEGPDKRTGDRLGLGRYTPGAPLPINFGKEPGYFWVRDAASPIGGAVTSEEGVQFGMPNLVFDYQNGFTSAGYTTLEDDIHNIIPSVNTNDDKAVGLFSAQQFSKFKGDIGGNVSAEELANEIARVKAPTSYDAANYLIPTPADFNASSNVDSFGIINGPPERLDQYNLKLYKAKIYAPLYKQNDQTDVLYDKSQVLSTIIEYMKLQESGVNKYRASLNHAALEIYNMGQKASGAAAGTVQGYKDAAAEIAEINFDVPIDEISKQKVKSCKSLAGQFLSFFYGGQGLPRENYIIDPADESCPTSLSDSLSEYFSSSANDPHYSPSHYNMEFSWNDGASLNNSPAKGLGVYSAYMPGPFTGVGGDGLASSPFNGQSRRELMRRNFYSTKFVTLKSLKQTEGYDEKKSNFSVYSEGTLNAGASLNSSQGTFANELDPNSVDSSDADLNSIKY